MHWRCLPSVLALGCLLAPASAMADGAAADESGVTQQAYRDRIEPLLARLCNECHRGDESDSGLRLDDLIQRGTVLDERQNWEKVSKKLHSREMPPEDQPQPTADERDQLTAWIDAELAKFDCGRERDPGRVTIRRLNRNEYNNTIRDLVGIDFKSAEDFPSDDVGYGFDNIGDVLSMPPILLEKYLTAAQDIVERALGTNQVNLATGELQGGEPLAEGGRILASESDVRTKLRLQGQGLYIVRVRAYGQQAGSEPVKMAVSLGDRLVRSFEVKAEAAAPQVYEGWLNHRGGEQTVSAAFKNDFYDPSLPERQDRNLVVQSIEVMGPYLPAYKQIIPREHTPEDKHLLAREVIQSFANRAFRRPAAPYEVERLLKLAEMAERDGENFAASLGVALQAMLVSPHFLFRVELDPEPNSPTAVRTINDFELATRLSYFLWSSMPDDELFSHARLGTLRQGDNLARQVKRMLADPKSQALVENFAGQWLQLRNLKTIAPDKAQFPTFNEGLRESMQQETELFFAEIMREDRSVLDFIDADFTFVDERLARHYGIPDIKGREFRKVQLDPEQRGGVLTQASVLTVTSNPTRTSPVKRGKWVLDNILNTPPPPPPPDVPPLEEDPAAIVSGSVRERLEQHRANPDCAICHNRMDPLGFGLENYDAIGRWRVEEGQFKIDPSGTLPGGESFSGPRELKGILKARQDEFVRCLAEKMLTFGLGRGVEYSDQCTVTDIAKAVKESDYRFSSLIVAIVHSEPFQKRKGKGSEP